MIPSLVALLRPALQDEATDEEIENFNGFVRVEVGLRLLEVLNLNNQPPLTIWALLQGHDLPSLKIELLDTKQRHEHVARGNNTVALARDC